ncbi:MAG TPA: CheR family methyltransferase [bacterium]|nr:CheR family methyltransferase [bacterium]
MKDAELVSLMAGWATDVLGFDHRALRPDRLLAAARKELALRGSAEAVAAAIRGRDPGLESALVASVTVGETYFYRQREHFDLLGHFPHAPGAPLKAWSAGCSTGEEAYSLTAALRRVTGLSAPLLKVWGTDINSAALETARTASYGTWSWRGTGPRAARLLEAEALDELNRACLSFARHNLLEPPSFDQGQGERFDLVFCRNVLVYFTPLAAARAIGHLVSALRPGGWLVLGSTDLSGAPAGFHRVGPGPICAYAKDGPAPARAPEPAPHPPERRPAPRPALKSEPAPQPLAQGPARWHESILAEMEHGHRAGALKELARLCDAHPQYLPGRFEHGLALRRAGHLAAAVREMSALLALADGRDLGEAVAGPETLSLEYYVTSAGNFIDSQGGGAW